MKTFIFILLLIPIGCAQHVKKEFWEDVAYRCPPEEDCPEGHSQSYDKELQKCVCVPHR